MEALEVHSMIKVPLGALEASSMMKVLPEALEAFSMMMPALKKMDITMTQAQTTRGQATARMETAMAGKEGMQAPLYRTITYGYIPVLQLQSHSLVIWLFQPRPH